MPRRSTSENTFGPPEPRFVMKPRVEIIGVTVSGQTFDFGLKEYSDLVKWGAVVEDCEFRLHDPRKASFYKATCRRCRFIAQRLQVEFNWCDVWMEDCFFQGTFRYCAFGLQSVTDPGQSVGLTRCDFSEARLDRCSFDNTDLSSMTWPKSAHVIFFEPLRHAEGIRALIPDYPIQTMLQGTAFRDERCSAVAYSEHYLRKMQKYPADQLELLFDRCRKVDFVRVNF